MTLQANGTVRLVGVFVPAAGAVLAQDGPAGPAFHDSPAPLGASAPGAVIRARAPEGTMALPSAARFAGAECAPNCASLPLAARP